jgi:peptide/nickel transport system permease protein
MVAIDSAALLDLSVEETPRRRVPVLRSLLRGLGVVVPVLFIATFITYGLGALSKFNPAGAVLGETATPADIKRLNHVYGLDRPFIVQYFSWVSHALHGDFGKSWFTQIPVTQSIEQRLPVSLSVAAFALLIALVLGTVVGIGAALNNGGWFDRGVTIVCSALSTIPGFVAAIALITIFAMSVPILPSGGYVSPSVNVGQWLKFLILPCLSLSLESAADLARQLRNGLVGTLRENYVTGAVVRGFSTRRVVFVHALRNGAGPALALLGLHIPRLIGGAVITETVFALPGLGQLAKDSALKGDVPVVQATLLVTIGLVLVSSLLVNVGLKRLRPGTGRQE